MTSSFDDRRLLEVAGVSKHFGGVKALTAANLSVRRGEIHTLLGENGAGKSTLVKIIAGVIRPDEGSITLAGRSYEHLDITAASRLGIKVIHQRLNTIPHLTVADNLMLGIEPARLGVIIGGRGRVQAAAALAALGVSLDLDRPAGTLSVAERQLLEIGRAIQGQARLLVMDEPTASIGKREVERLFDVARRLKNEGVGIIFISHRLEEILSLSDRITVMRDGRTIGTVDAADASPSRLVEMMVGRELAHGLTLERPTPSNESVLEVHELRSDAGLQGVSFTLRGGEILGVYGLMGSGRTELARALFGADPVSGGTVVLLGRQIAPRSPADAKRLGIGLVPEERRQAVFEFLSIRENFASASGDLSSRFGIVRRAEEMRLAKRLVQRLDVRTPSTETQMNRLSGGNQQKVLLGKWLMRDTRVLILDDPTSGVDVGAKREIYKLIAEQTRAGVSVLMTSSELPELLEIANRILVLHEGAVAGIVEGASMTQESVLRLSMGGASGVNRAGGAVTTQHA